MIREDHRLEAYPIKDDVRALKPSLPKTKPVKPVAFVLGHGLWNDVNTTASLLWLDQVAARVNDSMPWLAEHDAMYPRLFVTPSCAGPEKPERYIATQGNMMLARFEKAMGPAVQAKGFDHLGTYNLTIQNTSPDGTHAGFHANLVKAMMVFNWLYWVDTNGT